MSEGPRGFQGRPLTIVVEQFFDEVDVSENHPSTAVSLQLELIQCITACQVGRQSQRSWKSSDCEHDAPFADVLRQHLQIVIPFVAYDLSTGETAHWNNLHMKVMVNAPQARYNGMHAPW